MRSALGSDCVAAGVTFHTAFSRARLTLGMPEVFLTLCLVNPWNAHWSSSRSPEAQEKKQDRTLTTDSLYSWAHLFSTKSHPVSQSKCSGNPHLQAVAEMGAGAVQGWEERMGRREVWKAGGPVDKFPLTLSTATYSPDHGSFPQFIRWICLLNWCQFLVPGRAPSSAGRRQRCLLVQRQTGTTPQRLVSAVGLGICGAFP